MAKDGVVQELIPGRARITLLSELPVLIRTGVVVTVAAIVGVAALCQVGVLAPQFRVNGTGSGGGSVVAGPQPGPVFRRTPSWAWTVLQNVGWRGWEVTRVDAVGHSDVDFSAFLDPGRASDFDYPDRVTAVAATPALTHLPLTVARGGRLLVSARRRPASCAAPVVAPSHGPLPKVQATVHIATPLGERSVTASIFIEPAPTCPA